MKIRTTEQLQEAISTQLIWRRKELNAIKFLIGHNRDDRTRQAVIARAAVALLYAHWEGFVKGVSESYLEFIAMQRCKNGELADHLLAVSLRSKLTGAQSSTKIASHLEVVRFFRTQMNNRSRLPLKETIRTESNLSSVILMEILSTLGLSTSEYETKATLTDCRLLAKRNHVAHGSKEIIDIDDYLELHDEILGLMDLLRNQIENAAARKEYLRPSADGAD